MNYKRFLNLVAGTAGFMAAGLAGAATTNNVVVPPTLPFSDPGYIANGIITNTVTDTPDCTGATFVVNAAPVAGSGPGASTPPNTTVTTYIGFPAGNFTFANAGYGQYRITTTTSTCVTGSPPAPIVDFVTVAGIPTISNVLPATGSEVGGTSVVITGTYFTGATAVTFGGTPAASFTVDSDTQITAVTPAGTVGAVAVAVTAPGGTVGTGTFTYVQVAPIPTLSQWGMIILSMIMAGTTILTLRRRQD